MEIEKSLGSSAVSGRGDSGASSRLFATLLTWLSDRKTPVFVIGTSNNFTLLPPELVRSGRFDLCCWVDLPNEQDRKQIWEIQIKNKKRNPAKFDLDKLAAASDTFTGAEIEQLIISAMFKAYADNGKEFTTRMLIEECQNTIPQSVSNKAELDEMQRQAKGKLLMANEDGEASEITDKDMRKIAMS